MINKHISNFFYLIFVQCGNYIFPIITIPIVSRVFGPKLIGEYTYIQSIISYFILLISFGFSYTALRRVTRDFKTKDLVFSTVFFCQFLLFIFSSIVFVFLIVFVPVLHENLALSLICFSSCVSTLLDQNWIYQAFSDFKIITFVSLSTKLISMLGIVFFVRSHSDMNLYAAIMSVSLLLASVFSFFYSLKRYNIHFTKVTMDESLKFLKKDFFVFLSGVFSNLYTTTGVVLLGVYSSSYEVGLYTSAVKIIDLMRNVSLLPLNMLIFPLISNSFGKSIECGIDILQRIMPVFLFFCLISVLFINLAGSEVISVFFGQQFSEANEILSILSFGFVALFFGVIIGSQVILNLHYDKQFVLMQVVVAVISLSMNLFFLPGGGGVTTAYVWTISEFIMTFLQLYFIHRMGYPLFKLKYMCRPLSSLKYIMKQ